MDGRLRRVSCEDDICWVCLEGADEFSGCLEHPCSCPRGVHAKCLARWQLQSAGREEERYCRFCKSELPDWRDILTPKVPAAAPVMAIVYDGKVVRLQVKPGPEGMLEFQRQVRQAFNLGEDVELDCVFDCRAPGTGEKIKLRGLESYSAAMHCAAVAAGERVAKQQQRASTGQPGGSPGTPGTPRTTGSATPGSATSTTDTSRGRDSASSGSSAATGSGSSSGGGSSSRGNSSGGTPIIAAAAASPVTPSGMVFQPMRNPRTAPPALRAAPQSAASRMRPSESFESDQANFMPSPRTPRYDSVGGESCASAVETAPPAQQEGGGRRRNLLAGIVRGLGAVRRIL